jgi:hypothetical protein
MNSTYRICAIRSPRSEFYQVLPNKLVYTVDTQCILLLLSKVMPPWYRDTRHEADKDTHLVHNLMREIQMKTLPLFSPDNRDGPDFDSPAPRATAAHRGIVYRNLPQTANQK